MSYSNPYNRLIFTQSCSNFPKSAATCACILHYLYKFALRSFTHTLGSNFAIIIINSHSIYLGELFCDRNAGIFENKKRVCKRDRKKFLCLKKNKLWNISWKKNIWSIIFMHINIFFLLKFHVKTAFVLELYLKSCMCTCFCTCKTEIFLAIFYVMKTFALYLFVVT